MASKKEVKSENINPYFEVSLDTFLFNAGIIGFIQVLENLKATKGKDYFLNGQTLKVSKAFLSKTDTDLAQGYINAVCDKFKRDTFFEKIKTNEKVYKFELSKINSQYKVDEKTGKIKGGKYRQAISKIGLLQKKDYETELLKLDDEDRLEEIKKILELVQKDSIASSILDFNSVTGKITAFWGQFAFLDYANTSAYPLNLVIEKYFTNSIKNMLTDKAYKPDEEKIYDCFMCSNKIYKDYSYESLGQAQKKESKKKDEDKRKYYNTSFISGLSQDLVGKSSHFWNFKPDVYLCPLCAFIYACVPLGFIDVGYSTFVFINQNSGIEDIINDIKTYETNKQIDYKNKPNFFHAYITTKIKKKDYNLSSIEFIINEMVGDSYRYSIRNIDRNVVYLLKKSVANIGYIYKHNKPYQLANKDNLDIFNECVDNIFNGRDQYLLINKVMHSKIKDKKNTYTLLIDNAGIMKIIFSVLQIQVYKNTIFMKEENMNDRMEKVKKTCEAGDRLRREIAKNMDIHNYRSDDRVSDKVKSISFKLAGAVRADNSNLFLDITSHIYTSLGIDFPASFIDMIKNVDEFKELGHAYIIGLQNGYEKENKKEGEKYGE